MCTASSGPPGSTTWAQGVLEELRQIAHHHFWSKKRNSSWALLVAGWGQARTWARQRFSGHQKALPGQESGTQYPIQTHTLDG
jgi:hypothetical protein